MEEIFARGQVIQRNEISNKSDHCSKISQISTIKIPFSYLLTPLNGQKQEEDEKTDLISTNTHWRTPATPVHAEGPVSTSASCIKSPTEAANETNDTTYAMKSQSFNLWVMIVKKWGISNQISRRGENHSIFFYHQLSSKQKDLDFRDVKYSKPLWCFSHW